ncbi:Cytochrome P450 [Popillia japonica]|uniref:Cytochrome P450 n=1 Tax=Popillia japonica TaxID=7064 RepID=A0AAW1MDY8_POPJA
MPNDELKTHPDEEEILGRKKRKSFLDMLLEASKDGQVLTDQDIGEEVDTFMFEGHDTTTAGMCWSLFLLGNYPEIQEKLYEEVSSVLGANSTPTSIADLHEMKYLECCVKEALRLYPSVPFIIRRLEQEITLDGHKIPAGVQTLLHIYVLHRTAKYYPEPDKFNPDRFLPENCQGRHPYAYIPFSAGPRNCIGQKFAMYEEKTILASIIKNFKVTALETPESITVTADLILRPLNGVPIKLERRK